MTMPLSRLAGNAAVSLCMTALLSACSNISLWPFGREEIRERPRTPTNASSYQCANGKRFYLRKLDDGAAWVIFPDREVRLDKATGSGNRYSNGIAVLTLNGNEATLEDGAANSFAGCKKAEK